MAYRTAIVLLLPFVALIAQPASNDCVQRMAEDFVPATRSERLASAINGVIGPTAFVYTAIRAGINQADDKPNEWGQGAEGLGRRFASAYGEHFVSEALEHGIAFALHEDNRYFASGEQGFGRRLKYALASTFLTRHDDGSRSIALSSIGSAAGTAFISRVWQPRSTRSAGDGAVTFGTHYRDPRRLQRCPRILAAPVRQDVPMRGLLACALLVLPLGAADEKTVKSSGPDESLPKILWHEPRPTTLQDWICGPGGCDKAPKEPFQLIREDAGGTNPKVTVRDGAGHMWSAKFGAEVIPECFASRFVTALGYLAEPTYFVASGRIEGVEKLRRVREFVKKDGTFRKARFEMRGQKDFVVQQGQSWSWPDNPFLGSHELAGLKILMMLLSNWDAKDARDREESNNAVFRVEDGQRTILFYGVFDWGASLGHWGGLLRRDQSDCASYTQDTPHLVQGLRQNQVKWGFSGKHDTDLKNGISVEHVRWLLRYLQPITPEQLQTGLKASGATERQSGCWARAIDDRIQELRAIAR